MQALAYVYELGRTRALPEPVALQTLVGDIQAGRAGADHGRAFALAVQGRELRVQGVDRVQRPRLRPRRVCGACGSAGHEAAARFCKDCGAPL